MLSDGTQKYEEIPAVVPVVSLRQLEVLEAEVEDVQSTGQQEDEDATAQPGGGGEALEKGEKSSQVSAGELDEELVFCHPQHRGEVGHLQVAVSIIFLEERFLKRFS